MKAENTKPQLALGSCVNPSEILLYDTNGANVMSRSLSIPRGPLIEKPRNNRKYSEIVRIDPELRRGHLQIEVLCERDGYYRLRIDSRPADLVAFEGRLHWDDARTGPLVTDVKLLFSLRNQMGLSWACLRHNFDAVYRGAEVTA